MLSPKLQELIQQIEQLSPEQQNSIAEALTVEIKEVQEASVTLDALLAELDQDIAEGAIYDLDDLQRLV
jgi:hypothetical protein